MTYLDFVKLADALAQGSGIGVVILENFKLNALVAQAQAADLGQRVPGECLGALDLG